jgi:hypothetical protein
METFYALDGDAVGRKLEYFVMSNDEDSIVEYSKLINTAVNSLVTSLETSGCSIIFYGGDSVLAKSQSPIDVNNVPRLFDGATFSLGVGNSPLMAMLALKKAKATNPGGYVVEEGNHP